MEMRQGSRLFQARLHDLAPGAARRGLLIWDVAGELYRQANAGGSHKKSRALLWGLWIEPGGPATVEATTVERAM